MPENELIAKSKLAHAAMIFFENGLELTDKGRRKEFYNGMEFQIGRNTGGR